MPPSEFIYRGLSLHGFWLINWIRHAPCAEIREMSQKLGNLVAEGSLWAAVEQVYPLDEFKEAFKQSLNRIAAERSCSHLGLLMDHACEGPETTTKPLSGSTGESMALSRPVLWTTRSRPGLAIQNPWSARHAPWTRATLHWAYAGALEHGSSAEAHDAIALPR